MSEELTGGLDPVAGPEAPDDAVHDVEEEADDGLAVVGAPADDAGDAGVVGQGWSRECRGQVFERLVARAGAVGVVGIRTGMGSRLRGNDGCGSGAPAPYGVVAFYAGQLGYVFGDEPGSYGVDLLSSLELVAHFEAFIVELAADDVEVEVDDDLAVVGLLADYVGERAWLALFLICCGCFSCGS